MRLRTIGLCLIVMGAACVHAGCGQAPAPVPGESPSDDLRALKSRFVVIAHRGNSVEAPENTLAAIASGFAVGADLVEVDIRLSRDGVPVVFHDESLDRTTDGHGLVAEKTLAELKALDAGSWKGPQYIGERIPTLAEVLRASRGKGSLLLDVPVPNAGASIAAVLREVGSDAASFVAGTWDPAQRAEFATHFPGTMLLHSYDVPSTWNSDYFANERATGVEIFEIPNWSTAFISAAREHGMPVWVYTVNDEPTMREVVRAGAAGIETDRPALAIQVARELGARH